jgi:hypothetical protein
MLEIQSKKKLIAIWFLLSMEMNMNYKIYLADFCEGEASRDFRDNNLVIDSKKILNEL